MTVLKHLTFLASQIGPRGSTTIEERKGHDYIKKTLKQLGLAPIEERFTSLTSAYEPYIIGLGFILASYIAYTHTGSMGAYIGLGLTILSLLSIIGELLLRNNLLRGFCNKGVSQNVYATINTAKKSTKRVVLAAHVDTHRAPWIFRSRLHFTLSRMMSVVSFFSVLIILGLYIVAFYYPDFTTLRGSLIYALAPVALQLAILIAAHQSKYSPGANDNASGVSILLNLAEKYRNNRLKQTKITFLFTGCEEVGAFGMADYLNRHKYELRQTQFLIVDSVGGKNTSVNYLKSEGIFFPRKYNHKLISLAKRVSRDHPELGIKSANLPGAYTDAMHVLRAGLPALSILGLTRGGWIPKWHSKDDAVKYIDEKALEKTQNFIELLLLEIDRMS